ncbi:MAG TPA: serine/threonine-protein kinase [Polyangiaceae bacterium]|nr:serine/threonine-protein kinase [Polyangiaceae bacterium]
MTETNLIGLTLAGRIRITGIIGEGGMATVYRGAVEGQTGEVAIKIMNPDLAKESRFVRRFRREAKAASMLKHPNTVQIIEFGVDQGYVFLAMELLQGFDLAMLLHRERRIPEARAIQIAIQVCKALSAAHEQSIVHRDLKPDNIMLVKAPAGAALPVAGMSPSDFVKVLDFGIAKILDDDGEKNANADPRAEPITQEKSMLTRVGTIVGTPAYMAPEQGRAEAVDPRTDLYACGVLLYELISGRVPFTGETPMQVVMRHVNEPPRPPSDFLPVNADLERLIMRALAKWPSERQQSAEEMAFELLSVLPKVGGASAPQPEGENPNLKTLVIETGPPVPAPPPAAGRPAAPAAPARPAPAPARPAAGVPAAGVPAAAAAAAPAPAASSRAKPAAPARPAAGAPSASAAPIPPAKPSPPAFPTLNIEVPDDIFSALPKSEAPSAVVSTSPAPTRRADAPAPAGGAAPRVPVVRPGEGSPLAQTMESASTAPDSDDEEEEAATMIKSPELALSPAEKARVSLAEEAMARALGTSLPKVGGDEGFEPTLIEGPPPGTRPPLASDDAIDLKQLKETVKVDSEDAEKAIADALARANASATAEPTDGKGTAAAGAPEDRPARKPTSELIPVQLLEPAASPKPEAAATDAAAAVWQPKGTKRLGGATALIVGILIGALLVGVALVAMILLKKS